MGDGLLGRVMEPIAARILVDDHDANRSVRLRNGVRTKFSSRCWLIRSTRVAEPERLAFAVRGNRDLRGGRKGDAEAGSANGRSDAGVSLDLQQNPVLDERHARILGIYRAGGLGGTF
jgi:hypothetical protein